MPSSKAIEWLTRKMEGEFMECPDYTVSKCPQHGWLANYKNDGTRVRVGLWSRKEKVPVSKRTKREAMRRAKAAVRLRYQKDLLQSAVEGESFGSETISDFLDAANLDPGIKGEISAGTRERRRYVLEKFKLWLKWRKVSLSSDISKITTTLLEKWKIDRIEGNRPGSFPCQKTSIVRELTVIRRAFNYAIEAKIFPSLTFNPALLVRAGLNKNFTETVRDRQDRSMPEEIFDFLMSKSESSIEYDNRGTFKSIESAPFWMKTLMTFLSWTGCRPGEAMSLRWDGVVKKNGQTFGNVCGKTGSRIVPIPREVVEQLKFHKASMKKFGIVSEKVFVNEIGNPLNSQVAGRSFRRFQKRLGLEKTYPLYSMRHRYAHLLLERSVPINVVMKAMGHSDIRTTQIYTGVDIEDVADTILSALEN